MTRIIPGFVLLICVLGLLALLMGFYMSAYMGIYQEVVFTKYGKHNNEALFYNVCISLCFIVTFMW